MNNKFTYLNNSDNQNIEPFISWFKGPWNKENNNLYYNNGNIGIGTSNPQSKLQVVGDINANRFIGSGSLMTDLNPNNINNIIPQSKGGTGVSLLDTNFFDTSDNKLSLKVNSITPWNVNQNNLYYNIGNIGVGTNIPQTKLQVIGDISANRFIGSGSLMTELDSKNLFGIIPQSKGGTGVSFLDTKFFDTSNDKLSLKVNSIIGRSQTLGPIFERPLYIWEGYDIPLNESTSDIFKILEKVGNDTAYINTNYSVIVNNNNRYMIGINNTSKTNLKPTNYLRIKLPIDPNTHNAVFIQSKTRDSWSSINMFICDPITKVPDVKIQCRTNNQNNNNNGNNNGNSSFLGPNNQIAHMGHHEWLQYCIPKEFIDKYKTYSNEIIVSVNGGTNNSDISNNYFSISGIASCPNPYGLCTLSANDLCWATNGGETITPDNSSWNEEATSRFDANKDYIDIRIPIASTNKAVYIVHIDRGDLSTGSNPRIYVPRYSNTEYWQLSPTTIGKFGMSIKGRAQYREPRGIFLPADIVEKGAVKDHNGALQLQIRVNTMQALHNLNTRGWYSEQVEPL